MPVHCWWSTAKLFFKKSYLAAIAKLSSYTRLGIGPISYYDFWHWWMEMHLGVCVCLFARERVLPFFVLSTLANEDISSTVHAQRFSWLRSFFCFTISIDFFMPLWCENYRAYIRINFSCLKGKRYLDFTYRTLAIINRRYYCFRPLILMKLYLKNEIKNKN